MKKIVFACVHNAGRSQMAAAFFEALADSTKARAVSAGTQPAERVHAEVVEVMREVNLDLARVRPQLVTPQLLAGATLLVTTRTWSIEDPKGLPLERVRQIRDEVRAKVEALVDARTAARTRRARPSAEAPAATTHGHEGRLSTIGGASPTYS